jgi:hypothetical protein
MTLRSLIDKYRGWCPYFEEVPIQSSPFADLPLSGKMVFSTLMGTTGLLAILAAILLIPQYLTPDLLYSYGYFIIISNLLNIAAGLTIITLLFDFFINGGPLRRHKLEASLILSLWGAQSIISLLFGVYDLNNQMFTLTSTLSSAALTLTSATLFLYVSFRLLKDRSILVKWTFLLLSLYFVVPLVEYVWNLFDAEWRQSLAMDTKFSVATTMIVFAVAGYFFFRTYLAARSPASFTFKLPRYIGANVFLYGASQTILGVYATFLNPTQVPYNIMGFTYNHLDAIFLLQSVMFLLASFYLYRFDVGKGLLITKSRS